MVLLGPWCCLRLAFSLPSGGVGQSSWPNASTWPRLRACRSFPRVDYRGTNSSPDMIDTRLVRRRGGERSRV